MNDEEFAAWNSSNRAVVISYLEKEGIVSPQVGSRPAFEVALYLVGGGLLVIAQRTTLKKAVNVIPEPTLKTC